MQELDEAVRSADANRIAGALDKLAAEGASRAERERVKQLARETCSPVVRNAAAMTLADLHVDGTDRLLIDLVKRKETRGANGTLLYALRELKAFVPLSVLVDIIADDRSFEAGEAVLDLLSDNAERYAERELRAAIPALQRLAASDDQYLANVAQVAIGYLRPEPARNILPEALNQIGDLIRREVALFTAELREKAGRVRRGGVMIVIGGSVAFSGWLALIAAAVLALNTITEPWLAALVVGLVALASGGALIVIGKSRLGTGSTPSSSAPLPEQPWVRQKIQSE